MDDMTRREMAGGGAAIALLAIQELRAWYRDWKHESEDANLLQGWQALLEQRRDCGE